MDIETKRYGTLYVDPPWPVSGGKNGKSGWSKTVSPSAHYSLMSVNDITALPVASIAKDDSCLFLWVVNGFLAEGLNVMTAWNFRYVNNLVWRKTTGYGIGQYIRGDHEICLFGVRGSPGYKLDDLGKRVQVRSVVEAPRGAHSEKPEEMRRRVELIGHGPFVELFARKNVPGWDCWGNEIKNDVELFTEGSEHEEA